MFLPLPTDAVGVTHATPAPVPEDPSARCATVPAALAALAEELVETVPVRLTTTSSVVGASAGSEVRRPVLVARPRTSHEVAQVIRAARAHGVPVAVPSDEHGAAARAEGGSAEGASSEGASSEDVSDAWLSGEGLPGGADARDDVLPGEVDVPQPPRVPRGAPERQVTGTAADVPADPGVRALDGAVLVSTQGLTGVTILPVLARAHVGAGARWRDVLEAAAHYGLVPLGALRPGAERVAVASGRGGPRTADASRAPVRVPDDARVTDVLTARGVRAFSVVTGTGALRRVAPTARTALAGSVTTGGARGARGVVVAVELDLVERPAP